MNCNMDWIKLISAFLILKMSDYYDSSEDSYARNSNPVPLEMEYSQFAQITTHFPIAWRNNYITGTGGFDINLSAEKIELVFGDNTWYINKSDDLTIGMVFEQIFRSHFLAGQYAVPPDFGPRSFRLELDKWCAMNTDDFFALPLNKSFLCQGQLYLQK